MAFNEHLKRLRKISQCSQQELANYLHITVQSVSKWENGQSLPSIEFLPKIADFYGCSVNAFFSEYELQIFEQFVPIAQYDADFYKSILIANGILSRATEDISPDELDPTETIPLEALFVPALYTFLQGNERLSIAALQKELQIGYLLASRIAKALTNIGIIDNSDPNCLRRIVKNKVDLLLPYVQINKR